MQQTGKTSSFKLKMPIFLGISFIVLTLLLFWFNKNQLVIQTTLTTGDKMVKDLQILNDDLKNSRIAERDSTMKYQQMLKTAEVKSDSVSKIKDEKIQDLNEKVDSLQRILNSFQQGNLEPVQ